MLGVRSLLSVVGGQTTELKMYFLNSESKTDHEQRTTNMFLFCL